jgi:hypothetical protein
LSDIRFKKSLVDPKGDAKTNTEEQTKHYSGKANLHVCENLSLGIRMFNGRPCTLIQKANST